MRSVFPAAWILLLVGAITSATAAAPDDIEPLKFDHQDWTLACDNTLTCRAAGYQAEDFDAGEPALPVSVLLTRRAGPGTAVQGELTVDPGDTGTMPRDLTLRIDERDVGRLRLDAKSATARLSAAQTAALLAVLARNSRITVADAGGRRWTLSDRGASAVLLKMDEFQGRVGTPGALVRKGKRSETTVRAALPRPVVRLPARVPARPGDKALERSAALRKAIERAPLPADESCGEDSRADELEPGIEVVRLSGDRLLVSKACWLAAYNAGTGYWVVHDRPPYRPVLVTTSGSDYAKGQISASQKGRGLGDCWWTAEWSWDGTRFVQTSESTSGLCRGFAGGAWQLPTLVSEVKR